MAWTKLKRFWIKNKRNMTDYRADVGEDLRARLSSWRWLVAALLLMLLACAVLGFYWGQEPDSFSVQRNAELLINVKSVKPVVGATSTAAALTLARTLLDKPGGYLSNDMAPPGVWMDNIPSWEYGVLIQVRDFSKALRESFSRSQSQSREDKDLIQAEPRFNFNSNSWVLPSSESEYRQGIKLLNNYLQRLGDENDQGAQFYARADNLNYWLRTVESRLGSLSQRLSASVEQHRVNTDLAGSNSSQQSTATPREMIVKTSWWKIDNVFYESRGTAWALIHLLKAVEVDFADVIEKKNAAASLQQIVRELEATQESLHSPMVLNGGGFGVLANHSLVMASYISRANAAIIDLRGLLTEG